MFEGYLRDRGVRSIGLALSASGVQAVDDRVAATVLCRGVISLRSGVVATVTEWSKLV